MSYKAPSPGTALAATEAQTNVQLGGEHSKLIPNLARPQDGQALYLDGELVGFVVSKQAGCDAIMSNGRMLGLFNSEGAAIRAILAARCAI